MTDWKLHNDSRSQQFSNVPARSIDDALDILTREVANEREAGRTITSAMISPWHTSMFRYMVVVITEATR